MKMKLKKLLCLSFRDLIIDYRYR